MRLRLASRTGHDPVVEILHRERWVSVDGVPAIAEHCDPGDMVGVLGLGEPALAGALAGVGPDAGVGEGPDLGSPVQPLRPIGLREFPLWRAEVERVTATALRRFAGPVRRRALGMLPPRAGDAVAHVLGPRWERDPHGVRLDPRIVQGEGNAVPWPALTQALDVELGLGAVVVRPSPAGRRVRAADVIGGVVVVATVVARDVEHAELSVGRLGPSLSRDIAVVLGGIVATLGEFPHGRLGGLTTSMAVDGEPWADGTTAGAQHALDEVLTRAGQFRGLAAGDLVVVSGPPGGSGAGVDRWVGPGAVVTLEVERLGRVEVRIGDPAPHLHAGRLDRHPWTVVERRGHGPTVPAVDPVAWTPPPVPPAVGPLRQDTALDDVEVLPTPGASKPEDVAVGPDGAVYAGVEDGRIFRWRDGVGAGEVVADTHGRPLGIEVTGEGDLVVCDAGRGLLRIGVDGADVGPVEVLADAHAGLALRFTNNAAVGRDGTIYFSDSSTRFGINDYRGDLLEHGANGRLFAWTPGGGRNLDLLADGIGFPNGVALTPAEDALLFVGTSTYSLNRLWLSGPRAGERELLTDQLPGFGDNMCATGEGTYWVAIPNRRNAQLDRLLPHPGVRRVVARVPEALQPSEDGASIVVEVDGDGRVLRSLHGPAATYGMVTGMRPHDGWLYLSSLREPGLARLRLAQP